MVLAVKKKRAVKRGVIARRPASSIGAEAALEVKPEAMKRKAAQSIPAKSKRARLGNRAVQVKKHNLIDAWWHCDAQICKESGR